MRDMRAESYVQPMHGLERPLPPRRALRPPKMAVLAVAGGAVLMFGLSLVRTSDLRFLETSGSAEAAEIVPVAEPVIQVPEAAIQPEPLAIEVPQIETAAAAG